MWEVRGYACPLHLWFNFFINPKLLFNNKMVFFLQLHNYAFSAMGSHSLKCVSGCLCVVVLGMASAPKPDSGHSYSPWCWEGTSYRKVEAHT